MGTIDAFVLSGGTGNPGCYQICWDEEKGRQLLVRKMGEGGGGGGTRMILKRRAWIGDVGRSRLLSFPLILNTCLSCEEKSRCCYVLKKDSLLDKGTSLNCHLAMCI